jgi:RsmE family RNA methyltransferase
MRHGERLAPRGDPRSNGDVNLILLFDDDPRDGRRVTIRGARAAHVREVLRAEPGRELRVGLLDGPLGRGRVVASTADAVVLDCEFDAEPPPRPLVDLVLAVPRPKSLVKLWPEIAALGADRAVLLRTWRVAKPYLAAKALDPATYRPLLHDGMMQARTTREPRVAVEPLFRPWAEDRAKEFVGDALALVAHPTAATPLADVRVAATRRVVLAVGPEGGFVPFEVETLERAGFRAVSMGARTLRVETAVVALLAQIDLLRRLGATLHP